MARGAAQSGSSRTRKAQTPPNDAAAETGSDDAATQPKKKKTTTPRKKKQKTAVDETAPPVATWRRTWELIVELRRDRTAVVDSMGSEALADTETDEATRHYQTLVSLMLSSQTKDTVTAETMARLRAHGLTVENVLATPDDAFHDLIRKVGFHNNKLKYIKETTRRIRDEHAGRVPDTVEGLCALPGVGPKMALIVLRVNTGVCAGIAVDTHVHRVCNQLGWTGPKATKTPEQTRAAIEAWIPRDLWPEVNLVIVGLGQEVQTERAKLLRKALTACSDPVAALELLRTLGVDPAKEARKLLQLSSKNGRDDEADDDGGGDDPAEFLRELPPHLAEAVGFAQDSAKTSSS